MDTDNNMELEKELSMDEKRQGVVLPEDDLNSGHSRSVERRTVENVMEDSYLTGRT
jgi:hypothetical protein